MARITEPRVGETTTTTGTGPFATSAALTSHRRFSAVCSVADTFWGDIEAVGSDGLPSGDWVEGLCTYSAANEVTMTTVYRSSNANAAVTFGVGTKNIRMIADARQIAKLELLSGTNTGDQTSVSGNAGTATALQNARTIDGQSFDGTANITVIAPGTHAATSKATPVDADELSLVDSAASNVLKKLTWANLKATLKAYLTESIAIACSDETTALTTGTAKATFRMPFAMTVTEVRASLTTAQSSGSIFTVDINEAGVSIISTKLTVDNTERTSTTAATPPVISDASIADDAEITIDIDQVGDGTAKGLKVYLIGHVS
jgi:hypothetical protein